MHDKSLPESFGSRLVEQDETLHGPRYKEHRMQLELKLAQAEARERLVKRVTIGGVAAAALVFPLLASRLFGGADPFDKDATVLSVALGVIYAVGWIVFFLGIASYYSRVLPNVRRAREEMQSATIDELRHDIGELRSLVEKLTRDRDRGA